MEGVFRFGVGEVCVVVGQVLVVEVFDVVVQCQVFVEFLVQFQVLQVVGWQGIVDVVVVGYLVVDVFGV